MMTIGKLAKAANVSVGTVRFYVEKHLLQTPQKKGGFHYYPNSAITKIKFIKRVQDLGFTLEEIKELLEITVRDDSLCNDVLLQTEKKIDEIDKKISDLKRMKKSLKGIASCCDSREMPLGDCPILDCFIDLE